MHDRQNHDQRTGMAETAERTPVGKTDGRPTAMVVAYVLGGLALAPFLVILFGRQFVGTPQWAETSGTLGIVSGVLVGAFFLLVIARQVLKNTNRFRRTVGPIGFAAIGYAIGHLLVAATLPIGAALVAGREIEVDYTVSDVPQYGTKRCRNAVSFEEAPFMLDRLCNVEDRAGLRRGMKVTIGGRGTGMGLFAETFRRADRPRTSGSVQQGQQVLAVALDQLARF